MARYFFHLLDDEASVQDNEGLELAGSDAVARAALREARSMIGHDALEGCIRLSPRISVEDEARLCVHTLSFADAVTIMT